MSAKAGAARGGAAIALLASLALGAPRAEALCALGDLEMEESAWQAAAFWYRAAMLCRPPEGGGFVRPGCMITFRPCSSACAMTAWGNTGWPRR